MFGDKNYNETIGNISKLITKGTTPSTIGYNFVNSGVRFIKVENISTENILLNNFMYISEECNQTMDRSQLEKNDILFSIAGTLGKVAIISDSVLPANTNQALAIIKIDNQKVVPKFVYYSLIQNEIKTQIDNMKIVANRENLSLQNIADIRFYRPNKNEQLKFIDYTEEIDKLKFESIKCLIAYFLTSFNSI